MQKCNSQASQVFQPQSSRLRADRCIRDRSTFVIKSCEFGDLRDSLIRNQIVGGTNSESIRKMLIKKQDLTLNCCFWSWHEEKSYLDKTISQTRQICNRLFVVLHQEVTNSLPEAEKQQFNFHAQARKNARNAKK